MIKIYALCNTFSLDKECPMSDKASFPQEERKPLPGMLFFLLILLLVALFCLGGVELGRVLLKMA